MCVRLWLCVVAIVGLWCGCAAAGEQAPAEVKQAAEKARLKLAALEAQGAKWQVHWSDKTGLPRMIYGDKSKPHAGSVEDAARAFIGESADLLGVPADAAVAQPAPAAKSAAEVGQAGQPAVPAEPVALEFRKTRETGMAVGTRVSFQQYHRGIPVFEAELDVCTDAAGAVWHVTSTIHPKISVEVPPAGQLTGLGEWQRKQDDATVKGEPELVIFPDGPGKPAWKFQCTFGGTKGLWRMVIDARTGDVLRKTHLMLAD